MEKKFDLSSLRLDETGRVEIDATKLSALNENLMSAGGIDVYPLDDLTKTNWVMCGGTTNQGDECMNLYHCESTRNLDDCTNFKLCDRSKNDNKNCGPL